MIVDLTLSNFRSFQEEAVFSMNVERADFRHSSNFTELEAGGLKILRSAAIFGANASGKSNLLTALLALRWIITNSGSRKEGQSIPPYEPFRLSTSGTERPVEFEVEFIVPSGSRYRYDVAFTRDKIVREKLTSFAKRSRAVLFYRSPEDTWETINFGGNFKGGNRRFPFFPNASYISRAGNDASSPEFIREIYNYFNDMRHIVSGVSFFQSSKLADPSMLSAASELICLADTGVTKVTLEERDGGEEIKFPDGMPDELKEIIIKNNRFSEKYWMMSQSGELISFDEKDMSDGTVRLMEVVPLIIDVLKSGSVLIFDEIDANFHNDIVNLILKLFHDDDINRKKAQVIFTTHNTGVLNSDLLRRDQIWFVTKDKGASILRCLDEYDRKLVRHDSPFEAFYRDGRLGALPKIRYGKLKNAILSALGNDFAGTE